MLGEVTDAARIRELGDEGVLALVCDSTNALNQGHSGSEAKVRDSLIDLIAGLKGRVAVERRLGMLAHWSYDQGRHIGLLAALKVESTRLNQIRTEEGCPIILEAAE